MVASPASSFSRRVIEQRQPVARPRPLPKLGQRVLVDIDHPDREITVRPGLQPLVKIKGDLTQHLHRIGIGNAQQGERNHQQKSQQRRQQAADHETSLARFHSLSKAPAVALANLGGRPDAPESFPAVMQARADLQRAGISFSLVEST